MRRLWVARTERRTSAAARMRAHLLALGAWLSAWDRASVYTHCTGMSQRRQRWLGREAVAASWAAGWDAAARRWA
jgi:hypothetical protein